ncbi:MAG: hypothetical protein IJT88_09010 [Kiritimatiellae bacterium]|nr:hypothetical protein [Kiritimatiellia bacterium]
MLPRVAALDGRAQDQQRLDPDRLAADPSTDVSALLFPPAASPSNANP